MIKLENTEVVGWEAAIRGMRNPLNSWAKMDSEYHYKDQPNIPKRTIILGPNDHNLASKLANAGPVHAKYRRMITVYVDITAPLYWWKEFDTYKVGTVANSCSTMHKVAAKKFTLGDFSHEQLGEPTNDTDTIVRYTEAEEVFMLIIRSLNNSREKYLKTNDKRYWWEMIQLLPSSYNQKRTIMLNYEVLSGIYPMRKEHKLDEWREFCKWIESLPYSELIIGQN